MGKEIKMECYDKAGKLIKIITVPEPPKKTVTVIIKQGVHLDSPFGGLILCPIEER